MKANTATRLIQAIQLLKLDGYDNFTNKQLSQVSGVATRTIERNSKIVDILSFSLGSQGYSRCQILL